MSRVFTLCHNLKIKNFEDHETSSEEAAETLAGRLTGRRTGGRQKAPPRRDWRLQAPERQRSPQLRSTSFLKDKYKYSHFLSIMGTIMPMGLILFCMEDDFIKLGHKLLGHILKHKPVAALRGLKKYVKKKEQKKSFLQGFRCPLDDGSFHGSEDTYFLSAAQ